MLLIGLSLNLTGCNLIGAAMGTAISLAPLKLLFMCLPEGTEIDTPNGGRSAVETLKPGDTVIGYSGKPVIVQQVIAYNEDEEAERFLQVEFDTGASVNLCDMHRIGGIRAKNLKPGDRISSGQTVEKISVYGGVERSYDLLTEDAGYQIGGIPVNSMIEEMIAAAKSGKFRE